MQHSDPEGNIRWVNMDVPEHQSQNPDATRRTFYGPLTSDQVEAEESAAVVALQFLCSCYGFGINEYNYRESAVPNNERTIGRKKAPHTRNSASYYNACFKKYTQLRFSCLSKCKIQTP